MGNYLIDLRVLKEPELVSFERGGWSGARKAKSVLLASLYMEVIV